MGAIRRDNPAARGQLQQVGAVLWPEPARFTVDRPWRRPAAAPIADLLLVPGPARPRLLVPAGPGRVAAGVVRGYRADGTTPDRVRRRLLALLMRTRAGQRAWPFHARVYADEPGPAHGLERHLQEVLGQPVRAGCHLGPPRANRKPVLQLLDAGGRPVAFAKVSLNRLTAALVANEADALAALGGVPSDSLVVPRLLHHGLWRDHQLVVQQALPLIGAGSAPPTTLARAMREVATRAGTDLTRPADSPYWRRLATAASAVPDPALRAALTQVLADLDRPARDTTLSLGCWHGDWTSFNTAFRDGQVLVWDWERFARGVPVGFDALHYHLQEQLTRGRRPAEAAVPETMARAPALLAPLGVGPAQASLVACLYLVELAARYAADRQDALGARHAGLGAKMLPALRSSADRLVSGRR